LAAIEGFSLQTIGYIDGTDVQNMFAVLSTDLIVLLQCTDYRHNIEQTTNSCIKETVNMLRELTGLSAKLVASSGRVCTSIFFYSI
jgi:hypothetical protein